MSKKLLIIFVALLFPVSGFCEKKITGSEFKTLYDSGKVSLRRAPVVPGDDRMIDSLAKQTKKTYPKFREGFLYIAHFKTNDYQYSIAYEWWSGKCVFRAEKYAKDKKTGKPYGFEEIDIKGEIIEDRYCEQIYSFRK